MSNINITDLTLHIDVSLHGLAFAYREIPMLF
jgi:hypothetical protein